MSEYISNRSNIISFDNVITAPGNGGASYFEGIWETAYSFAENIISRIASCLTDILWKIWNAFKFEGDNQPQPKAVAEGSISVLKSEPFISNILNNYDIQCSEAPDELSDALDQLNTSKTSVILPIKQVIVGLSGESLVGDGSKDGCNIQVNDCLPEHISNIAVKSSFAEGACFKHKYPFLKEIENVSFNYSLILKDISAGEYACIGVNKKIVAGICSKFFEELNVVNMAYHAEMMALRDIILFSKKGGERLSSLDNDKIASTLCKAINDDIENGYNGDEKDYVYLDRGPFILSSGTVERLSNSVLLLRNFIVNMDLVLKTELLAYNPEHSYDYSSVIKRISEHAHKILSFLEHRYSQDVYNKYNGVPEVVRVGRKIKKKRFPSVSANTFFKEHCDVPFYKGGGDKKVTLRGTLLFRSEDRYTILNDEGLVEEVVVRGFKDSEKKVRFDKDNWSLF